MTGLERWNELARLINEQERDDRYGHRVDDIPVNPLGMAHVLTAGADGLLVLPRRVLAHDDRHGTLYCYVRLRCRCVKCKATSAAYQRERRRKSLPPDERAEASA